MIIKIDGLSPDQFARLGVFLASGENRLVVHTGKVDALDREGVNPNVAPFVVKLANSKAGDDDSHNVVLQIPTVYSLQLENSTTRRNTENYDLPVPGRFLRDLMKCLGLFSQI